MSLLEYTLLILYLPSLHNVLDTDSPGLRYSKICLYNTMGSNMISVSSSLSLSPNPWLDFTFFCVLVLELGFTCNDHIDDISFIL